MSDNELPSEAYPTTLKNAATSPWLATEIKNEADFMIKNGLGDALGFPGAGNPQNPNNSTQLSQVDTLFQSNRWYLVSNMRQLLSQIYVEHGLIQTVVDLPVDDALRGGIDITSKQLDEDDIKTLQLAIDRDDDIAHIAQAQKWNRLFGGGAVLVLTDQPSDTPLNLEAIGEDSPLEFRAVDLWELYFDKQNLDGEDDGRETQLGKADDVLLDKDLKYNYYGKQVHHTRVIIMKGLTAPSMLRPRLRGWGFSVVESVVRSINQYLKSTDLSFEVLDEFKLDVFKFEGLYDALQQPGGTAKIQQRVALANWSKNYQNALVMDMKDDFDHKQLSFSGLAEAQTGIRSQVASDLRIPQTKLFGQSAAGFSSGEDDIEVYNGMVESTVRSKLKHPILRVIEIKCQKLFGMVPDDLGVNFKPLRMLSSTEEENVKTQKFTRLLQAKQAGELTTFEFRDACNKGSLLDIQLDTAADTLNPDDPEAESVIGKEGLGDPNNPPDPTDSEAENVEPDKSVKEDEPRLRIANTVSLYQRFLNWLKNDAGFDRASYLADGGDDWIDPREKDFFDHPPVGVDSGLWDQAKHQSEIVWGMQRWQFVLWTYKKLGGKFGV